MSGELPIYIHIVARLSFNPPIIGVVLSATEWIPDYTPIERIEDTFYYIVTGDEQFTRDYIRGGVQFNRYFAEIAPYIQPLPSEIILEVSGRLKNTPGYPYFNIPRAIYDITHAIFMA